jgi:hypothetical protein
MASTFEPERACGRGARRGSSPLLVAIATALGCRAPGLPPEPPERDAASAEAEIPAYSPAPDPLSTSAFAGEKLREGGHGHHGHGGHGKAAKEGKAEPAPTATGTDPPRGGHAGHATESPPSDTDPLEVRR